MSRLMRTIFQNGVLYFFVMAGFHIAMVFFTFFARVIAFLLLAKKMYPDRHNIPAFHSQFPAGRDHCVRILPPRLSFTANVESPV